VVIVGFGRFEPTTKRIHDYDPDPNHPTVVVVRNLSPYLTEGADTVVRKERKPLCRVPEIRCGNKPTDDGNFILTEAEKKELVAHEPGAARFLFPYLGAEEFINGWQRWCLWLEDASPAELRALPEVMRRIDAVREFRLKSTAAPTRKAAATPTRFFYVSQPRTDYILIPEVSSERRHFIPIGFVSKSVISANTNFLVPSSDPFLFGVLTSSMHMAWTRQIGGRLKSDYRYSGSMVYNTFPWPDSAGNEQKAAVAQAAQSVLAARARFPTSPLADLYDPNVMPPALTEAHALLDRAVDRCYRREPFPSDRARVEHLFTRYEKLAAPLVPTAPKARARPRFAAAPRGTLQTHSRAGGRRRRTLLFCEGGTDDLSTFC
jgi:hypothetical protein